ncbi:MAG TPA: ethanolamine permease, partial [Turneriella sp.]|nr:ethanolamine permease [Turneriella sp.]
YLHHRFARLHHTRQTPAEALVLNMLLGIAILLSGKTAEMIVLAAFGALTIYVMALVSQLVLRQTQPGLERPFRTPLFPYVPITALVIAIFSLGAMVYFNGTLFVIYVALLAAGSIYFYLVHLRRQRDL